MPEITTLAEEVKAARDAGRKRVTIGGYRVNIHPNYALFGPLRNKNSTPKPDHRDRRSK